MIAVVVLVIILVTNSANNMPEAFEGVEDDSAMTNDSAPKSSQTTTPAKTSTTNTSTRVQPTTTYTSPVQTVVPTQTATHEVRYLESGGFLPRSITVNVGSTVVFNNVGTKPMWVISDNYPGTSNSICGTSTQSLYFNQCQIGSYYTFTPSVKGVWTYYNKEAPQHSATVIVQ